jgi:predicted acylesterase/phospholipase RssA
LGIDFQHIVGVSGSYIVAALHSSGMTLEQIKLRVF